MLGEESEKMACWSPGLYVILEMIRSGIIIPWSGFGNAANWSFRAQWMSDFSKIEHVCWEILSKVVIQEPEYVWIGAGVGVVGLVVGLGNLAKW